MKKQRIRAEIDGRSEKIGAKIRDAEINKVPYMFIIGKREAETNGVSIRRHGQGDVGSKSFEEALQVIKTDIESKGLTDQETKENE